MWGGLKLLRDYFSIKKILLHTKESPTYLGSSTSNFPSPGFSAVALMAEMDKAKPKKGQ